MINFSRITTVSIVILLIFVVSNSVFANSHNPPDGRTGAPNEGDCTDCHTSYTLNAAGGSLVLTVPKVYIPGKEYDIVVDLMRTGQSRWGFQMTALNGNNARAGTFATVDSNTQLAEMNSKQYIEQTTAGTAQGTPNKNQWMFKWTAPSTDVGPITFYAAGNAANNNLVTSGDYIYTQNTTSDAVSYNVTLTGVGEITKSTSDASSGINYTLRVTNNGNITDTFNLETSGDVTATLSQTSVQLNAGTSTNITLSLPGSALTTAGDYDVKVKATSQGDNSKSSEITTTTTILPVYDIALTGVGSLAKTTNADTGASYTLRITNNGNTEDTIRLATSGDINATISSTSVTLDPDASSTVTLRVSGDALAKAGDYEVKVTATSQGDDTITDEITTTTTIPPVYGFTLAGVGALKTETTDASEGVSYTLNITNTGNTDDVIALTTDGTGTSLSKTEVPLAYGEAADVVLSLAGDTLAKAGDYIVKVTAVSQNDDTITSQVTTTTKILPVYSFTLEGVGELKTETADASDGVSYTLKITNTGNTDDVVTLSTDGTGTSLSKTEVPLAYGEAANVVLTLAGDTLAKAGDYIVKVTAVSQNDDTVTSQITTTTEILPVYSFTLEGVGELKTETADASEGVSYTLKITNTGNTDDVIKLSTDGAGTTLSQTEVSLAYGEAADVVLTLSSESLAKAGEYIVKVTAVSQNDDTITSQVTTTTKILPVYSFTLEGVGELKTETTDASEGVSYTLKITNTGNTDDVITLTTDGTGTSLSKTEVPLAYGEAADVVLSLAGDTLAKAGEYIVKVTAVSQNDDTITSQITTTTEILPVYSFTLEGVGELKTETADASDGVSYTLKITNTGNTDDVITLTTDGTGTSLSKTEVPIAYGESAEVVLTLSSESLAKAGEYIVKVTAVSQNDNTITSQITTTTTIQPVYGFTLEGVGELITETTDASDGVRYTLKITNTGNADDVITLTTDGTGTSLSKTEVSLAYGEAADVVLTLAGDTLAKAGEYIVKVTAVSQNDDTITSQITTTTEILPVYSFTLEGVGELITETTDASEGVSYTLKITNTGNTDDIITLTTDGTGTSLSKTEVPLAYGESADVVLTLAGDTLAKAGEYIVKVTAVSQNDDTVTSQVTTTTTIQPVYGLTLEGVGELKTETADASDGVRYTLKITNTGNADDVIALTTDGTGTTLSKTEVPLAYGEAADVVLTLAGDTLAKAGEYIVKVTAVSQNDDTITSQVTTTTTIQPVYGFTLEGVGELKTETNDVSEGVSYTLKITNTGNTDDAITLTAAGTEASLSKNEVLIAYNASVEVILTISADDLATAGKYEVKVTATSQGDNSITHEVTTTTTILPVYGVTLKSEGLTTGATQDSVTGVTYPLTITNTGNIEDTFVLGSSAEVGIGGAVLGAFKRSEEQEIPTAQLEITLAAGVSADVLFIASGDLLTSVGEYVITVTATSTGDNTKSAEVQTTTTIVAVPPVYEVTLVGKGELTSSTDNAVEGSTYTLTVTNTGNTNDTILLSSSAETGIKGSVLGAFKLSEDQETATSQLEFELGEDESKDVLFTVAGDLFTESGEYEVNVTATSRSDSTKSAEVTTTTTIHPVYDVTLVGKGDLTTDTAEVRDWIRYAFTLKNTGNTSGDVDLVAQADIPVEIRVNTVTNLEDGEELTLVIDYVAPSVDTAKKQTSVFLRPGGTAEVSIYVFAEGLEKAGEYEVKVIATHQGDKTKTAEVTTKTTITPVYGVKLQGKDELIGETMDPLKGVSFVLTVTNEGNIEDTILLGSSAELGIEGTVLGSFTASDVQEVPTSQIEVLLAPGASTEVTFIAKGDFFTKPGEYEIVVSATSKGDDTKIAEITTTTTITPVPWDLNADGTVNILDLVLVSNQFGESGEGLSGDVNMDGTVNILDLVQVASYFGKSHVEILQENQ